MNLSRRTAVVAGVFFLLTEIGAIVGALLYTPLLNGPDYIVSPGDDTSVFLGACFEVILVISAVGTAVTLYPILKRQNEALAIAYVSARVLEAAVIVVGIISLLAVVTLRQDLAASADADAAMLVTVGSSLLAIHEWTFFFGPGIALGIGSVLLASLMYTTRLVPRAIAVLGLVGGALICASSVAVLFGAYEQVSTIGLVVALPVFAWEVSLAVWLIAKGFRAVPVLTGTALERVVESQPSAAAVSR
ncbi:MAG TPA: DUF4386 domain-containing protein [Glaciibacter sp.]|nr:DUF4386 domain-containing protein [Glaciibacter sp.]